MAATQKQISELETNFKLRRIQNDKGSFLECLHKEGTQELHIKSTPRDKIPGISTVIMALKQLNPEYINQIYSIIING
ncbi:hypothetical protein ACJMK2_025033 [Sinanodonta woodiana]|uniref:Uncharacterized protein n=1 Tax=Sinanodonta woodiana TaxID=1069815 RepID=A0ABD3XF91_SINWO